MCSYDRFVWSWPAISIDIYLDYMHIYVSGIGGVGLGPLAKIGNDAGFKVTGSNDKPNKYLKSFEARPNINIHIGQTREAIAKIHANDPIDWFVHTAALPNDHPELEFAMSNSIKTSKRDEFINMILKHHKLKLIAVCGTHGKTSTTAMLVWLFLQNDLPVSYSIGTNISFGENGKLDPKSEFFIYEADEFDKNMLKFNPHTSLIPSCDFDHPDSYADVNDYKNSFLQFIDQSVTTHTWSRVANYLDVKISSNVRLLDEVAANNATTLTGKHMRQNAFLAASVFSKITGIDMESSLGCINEFPGTERRFELIAKNLYSDYAHHPVEIKATIQAMTELGINPVVIYQPHQNIRQHELLDKYKGCFEGAKQVIWLPTFLSRESDSKLPILSSQTLAKAADSEGISNYGQMGSKLKAAIKQSLESGDTVVCLTGGDFDPWIRNNFLASTTQN